jgi:hypothetical protein
MSHRCGIVYRGFTLCVSFRRGARVFPCESGKTRGSRLGVGCASKSLCGHEFHSFCLFPVYATAFLFLSSFQLGLPLRPSHLLGNTLMHC